MKEYYQFSSGAVVSVKKWRSCPFKVRDNYKKSHGPIIAKWRVTAKPEITLTDWILLGLKN